jgi:3-dehydroquinate dehydratase/shikimate dehydrogenase
MTDAVSGTRATLVASLVGDHGLASLGGLPPEIDVLEVRADRLGDVAPERLRERFPGHLLYTLRSEAERGSATDSLPERWARLIEASRDFDFVDLEGERDLVPEVLDHVPPGKRVISWHGPASGRPLELVERAQRFLAFDPRLVKLVTFAETPGESLEPVAALSSLSAGERRRVSAFAAGAVGTWTRLVAAHRAAPWLYLAASSALEERAAPGQPDARRWIADYGLPDLRPVSSLFGVVGHPVDRSLSPRLHNRAYARLGLAALYVPFDMPSFGDFWLDVVEDEALTELGLPLRGLSVTTPFKGAAVGIGGAASPLADQLESANTLVLRDGVWEADTTDAEGVVGALARFRVPVDGREVAVVGAGAAGRVAAAGLKAAGAHVTLFNRDSERGRRSAEIARVVFRPLGDFAPETFAVVVHATSLGRAADDVAPIAIDRLRPGTAVVDLVYGEVPTRLIRDAGRRGLTAIDGRHVLLDQARGQFRRMTGAEMDVDAALAALDLETPMASAKARGNPT